MLADEIQAEINRELIDLVSASAVAGGSTAWDFADADGRWQNEKFLNFYSYVNKVSNAIAVSTRRGRGNVAIAHPDICTMLESANMVQNINSGIDHGPMGEEGHVAFVGYLRNGMKLFRDTFRTTLTMDIGYKGKSRLDAGLYFLPYVPIQLVRAKGEEDFQPRLAMRTRYGTASNPFGASNYFRQLTVTLDGTGGLFL